MCIGASFAPETKLTREVKIDDPIIWLNNVVMKVTGEYLDLRVIEFFELPTALVCDGKGNKTVVFSPIAPVDIKQLKLPQINKLRKTLINNPLCCLPKNSKAIELSMLNCGIFFDLELCLGWQLLTNEQSAPINSIWMYIWQN
jgi:hypothetical protein